ncbi:MAG TPA: hypothetical protein VI653_27045 [Steroidobacteraceae bacterium]
MTEDSPVIINHEGSRLLAKIEDDNALDRIKAIVHAIRHAAITQAW